MRRVAQEHANGCGLATAAMLTGRTYASVLADVDRDRREIDRIEKPRDWDTDGCSSFEIDRYLVRWHGFYLQRTYASWHLADRWPPAPWASLHYAQVRQPSNNHHFVAMDRGGRVFDPLREGVFSLAEWDEVVNVCAVLR